MTRSEYLRTAGVALTYVLTLLDRAGDTGDLSDRLLALKRDMLACEAMSPEPWLPPTEKSLREAQKRAAVTRS
jgi:hypothetical protein